MTGTITSSRHAAAMIVSVVQATIHVKPVFDHLSLPQIEDIVLCWTSLIEANPETATEQIWQDIFDRPGLGEAWRKSGPDGPLSRRDIFANIILEYARVANAETKAIMPDSRFLPGSLLAEVQHRKARLDDEGLVHFIPQCFTGTGRVEVAAHAQFSLGPCLRDVVVFSILTKSVSSVILNGQDRNARVTESLQSVESRSRRKTNGDCRA